MPETGHELTDALDTDSPFPLWAKIESENIYLYGIRPFGYVLYQDGKGTYFDWPGLTPRRVLPQIAYADFDRDGEKELAVLLYTGSGSGFAQMDVHILEIKETDYGPEYTEHILIADQIETWFTERIVSALCDGGKTIHINFNHSDYIVNSDYSFSSDYDNALESLGEYTGIQFGDIVHFSFDKDRIRTKFALGFCYEKCPIPLFFADVGADVVYDGSRFTLENYSVEIYDRYRTG